jgi:GNAT superfamily N-acetyltransferase
MESACSVKLQKRKIELREIDLVADRDELLELYSIAFEDQKQYINVSLASGQAHRDALRVIFDIRLNMIEGLIAQGAEMLVASIDGKIVGAGGFAPNSCNTTAWDFWTSGVLWLPFRLGYGAFMRALKLGGKLSDTEIDPLGAKIMMMAVLPELHGQGVGGKILQTLIERWDGGDLVLLTQLESSVKFYTNFGFVLTAEVKKDGYSNWSMLRRKPEVSNNSEAQSIGDALVPVPMPMRKETGISETKSKSDDVNALPTPIAIAPAVSKETGTSEITKSLSPGDVHVLPMKDPISVPIPILQT